MDELLIGIGRVQSSTVHNVLIERAIHVLGNPAIDSLVQTSLFRRRSGLFSDRRFQLSVARVKASDLIEAVQPPLNSFQPGFVEMKRGFGPPSDKSSFFEHRYCALDMLVRQIEMRLELRLRGAKAVSSNRCLRTGLARASNSLDKRKSSSPPGSVTRPAPRFFNIARKAVKDSDGTTSAGINRSNSLLMQESAEPMQGSAEWCVQKY